MARLVVANGTVANGDGVAQADVTIDDGRIVAVGAALPGADRVIDAAGLLVLPGGVDSHCHIEQLSGAGLMNADTFASAHAAALRGGTTTTVSFAAQHPGMRLGDVVADYTARAKRGARIDHAFHIIVSDTSGDNLTADLPALMAQGHRSVKVFTVYDKVRVADEPLLDILWTVRAHGGIVCVHAENDGIIRWMTRRLLDAGRTAPRFHAAAHAELAEVEALHRIALFARFTGQPVMLFHISGAAGLDVVRRAMADGAPVRAETCPHYLFQTVAVLDGPDAPGFLCSPPQRQAADQAALWDGLADGTLSIVSSDHAPYRLDASGKFAHGADAPFPRIANGQPGLAERLPLMFDAMVAGGRLGVAAFARVTAQAPAETFGLTAKGRIAPGFDGDLTLWNPQATHRIEAPEDGAGYSPWAGRDLRGRPVLVLRRGVVAMEGGRVLAEPGSGRRVPMAVSAAMRPAPHDPDIPA
jgi:dihydropyrimidinase